MSTYNDDERDTTGYIKKEDMIEYKYPKLLPLKTTIKQQVQKLYAITDYEIYHNVDECLEDEIYKDEYFENTNELNELIEQNEEIDSEEEIDLTMTKVMDNTIYKKFSST